jgi:hypothetical protein
LESNIGISGGLGDSVSFSTFYGQVYGAIGRSGGVSFDISTILRYEDNTIAYVGV